jgi:hypothetical protein
LVLSMIRSIHLLQSCCDVPPVKGTKKKRGGGGCQSHDSLFRPKQRIRVSEPALRILLGRFGLFAFPRRYTSYNFTFRIDFYFSHLSEHVFIPCPLKIIQATTRRVAARTKLAEGPIFLKAKTTQCGGLLHGPPPRTHTRLTCARESVWIPPVIRLGAKRWRKL